MAHRRVKLAAAALASCLALAALPGGAEAQFFGNWGGWDNGGTWDGLPPQQVRRAIADRGFRVLAPLRRNGSVFVADVLDSRGRHERLIVAAADAQILQRFLIDDGRQLAAVMRGGDAVGRGADDGDGLVPPADIPDARRRFARPTDRAVPQERFGDAVPGDTDGDGETAILPTPPLRHAAPPLRTVKPRPRVADRSPDVAAPGREPGAVETAPLAPAAPRPLSSPSAAAPAPVAAPAAAAPAAIKVPPQATVASVPASVPAASAAPTVAKAAASPTAASRPAGSDPVSAAQARRPSDPLAIPGSAAAESRPVRSVSGGITGTPPAAPAPGKAADVPVAPLD